MEKPVLAAVGLATVAAVGIGVYVWRTRSAKAAVAPVAPTAKPIPAEAPVAPGVVSDALEIDKTTNVVNVRGRDAQELLKILNDYELDPGVEPFGTPSTTDTLGGSFNLRPKAAAPAAYFSGHPASAWLVEAAKAGFDILINDRVTALLAGKPIPKPAGTPSKFTADILVIGPADRPVYAQYMEGKDVDHRYAILIRGDGIPGGPKAVPAPPGGYSKGAVPLDPGTNTDAAKVAKEVSMGLALSRAQRARLWGGARLSNDPN